MDRRDTSPKRVTSLTWGPPPPSKQALSFLTPHLIENVRLIKSNNTCVLQILTEHADDVNKLRPRDM